MPTQRLDSDEIRISIQQQDLYIYTMRKFSVRRGKIDDKKKERRVADIAWK